MLGRVELTGICLCSGAVRRTAGINGGGLGAWRGARSGEMGGGGRGLLIGVEGEGDRRLNAGIERGAKSPARRDSGARKKEGGVTLASAVGADVWTPHVSD